MKKGWLKWHFETFVEPVIGSIPAKVRFFTPEEMSVIKSMWRSAKAHAAGRPILLAGRDTFVFEILARREGRNTVFRPDISRATVSYVKECYRQGYFLLDTGFIGSIPKALGVTDFKLASGKSQVFPTLTQSRALALKIEAMPKYWQKAQYTAEGAITQELSDPLEFARAAAVTIGVYTDSSPNFIPTPRPINVDRWQNLL